MKSASTIRNRLTATARINNSDAPFGFNFAIHLILCFALIGTTASATDYFISNSGDDDSLGTSSDQPWRTLVRLSKASPGLGDSIFLRGGDVFTGPLQIEASPVNPKMGGQMLIASYGTGLANISVRERSAVVVRNMGDVSIRRLRVTGGGRHSAFGSGVDFECTEPDGVRLGKISIEQVEACGFSNAGISVTVVTKKFNSRSGYDGITIRGCVAWDNARYGILVAGDFDMPSEGVPHYNHKEVSVLECVARDNPGDPTYLENHSGNGILIGSVDGGCIERCVAYRNGELCFNRSGGPVGIWTYASRGVVIRLCASCDNRTGNAPDGGGFDLDGGCQQCTIEYCYSSNNDGAGYLLYDYVGSPMAWKDNVLQFCVSENDGRKGAYGGIVFGGEIDGCDVYQNTVYLGTSPKHGRPACVRFIDNLKAQRLRFFNNAFVTTADHPVVGGVLPNGTSFAGNLYWSETGRPQFDGFQGGFDEWQQTMQHEISASPNFKQSGLNQFIEVIAQLKSLQSYEPTPGSPLIGAGIELSQYGIQSNVGEKPDIGVGNAITVRLNSNRQVGTP